MAHSWARSEAVVAQKMNKNQIGGLFRKEIIVGPREECIIEKNGKIVERFGPGKHNVGGRFDKSLTDVTLIDISEKIIRRSVERLLTRDFQEVAASIEMKVKVVSSDSLFGNLMKSKNLLLMDDIWTQASQEFLARVAMPEVKKKDARDLYGNRAMLDRLKASIEVEMRNTLKEWGIELVSFNLVWAFSPEFENHVRSLGARRRVEEEKELDFEEDIKEAAHHRDIEKVKGGKVRPVEETRAEMENERIRRETEMNLDKEEAQEDMEEAVEALKLKRIKDRQKPPAAVEEEIESLEELKAEAENNYYKKKIDEATFNKLAADYEEKIAMLRVKQKRGKE